MQPHLSGEGELQFQEFSLDGSDARVSSVQRQADTYHFTHASYDEPEPDDSKAQLLPGPGGNRSDQRMPSFFSFDYYQKLFDVETTQVIKRICNSMIPRVDSNYIQEHLRPYPDLYGPFWIATTLIFTNAIAGNIAGFLMSAGSTQDYHGSYNFGIVTGSAAVIYCYVSVCPVLLYFLLWWRKSDIQYTFLEILASYGYSLSAYVFMTILWMMPWWWLQWGILALCAFLSSCVLMFTYWPAFRNDSKLVALTVTFIIVALHVLLAVGFKTFFFHSPTSTPLLDHIATTAAAAPLEPEAVVHSNVTAPTA